VTATFSYRAAVAAIATGNIAVLSSLYVTQPVLPRLASDFRVTAATANLSVSLCTLGLAVSLLVLGSLSDRVGKRRVMLVASGALILPTLGVALAPNFGVLLLFRILQGVCSAGVGSISLAYIIQEFPPERVGSALGWGTLSFVAAALVGRVGGGIVAGATSWRVMFLVFAILDLVGSALMAWYLPAERSFTPAVGTQVRALLAHARRPRLLLIDVIGFFVSFTLLSYFAQLSYYLSGPPFRLATGALGLVYLVYVVGALAPVAGSISTRVGRKWVIAAGLVLLLTGSLASLMANLLVIILGTAVASLGLFIAHTADNAYVGDVASTDRGAATALYMFWYYLGGAVGVAALGLAWQRWGWAGEVAGCVGASIAGLLLSLLLPSTTGPVDLHEPGSAL
jgi:YNFM family putative membrane transporter